MVDFMKVVTLKNAEILDISESLCIILDGELAVEQASGTRADRYKAGSVIGEVGLLHRVGHHVEMRALRKTKLAKLSRKVYSEGIEFSR